MKRTRRWAGWFLLLSLTGVFSAAAQSDPGPTNEWTKATSGYWEEPYWSLGHLPGPDQDTAALRNPGWKALAIGQNTTANYPGALTVTNLVIDAPVDSFNQLLLNWAGLTVPLVVRSDLVVGLNGSLVSHYSALRAATATIRGPASFADEATEDFGLLELWETTVSLTNGTMTCSNLVMHHGTFVQVGGTHRVKAIDMEAEMDSYYLQGGALISQQLQIGSPWGYVPETHPVVWQTGGVHTNGTLNIIRPDGNGSYRLDQGLFVSGNVYIDEGNAFVQNGGTNISQALFLTRGARFALAAGNLSSANPAITSGYYNKSNATTFAQSGGQHTVAGVLLLERDNISSLQPVYELAGGTLNAAEIRVQDAVLSVGAQGILLSSNLAILGGTLRLSAQGVVSNTGTLTLSNAYNVARISAENASATQHLGQLQILGGGALDMHASSNPPVTGTVLRFSDSHALAWTGQLQITNWGLHPEDHIFIGTGAQGLTAAQLDRVVFLQADASYPAGLGPTGELVPLPRNDWTKPTSGYWEEPYWSLGRLPGNDQGLVVFGNPGSKTLAITANTAANYPASLSLKNLVVAGASNQLLLDWVGLTVPLSLQFDLTIGLYASLASHYSALRAANVYNDGSVTFSDNAVEDFGRLWLRSGATVDLTNGTMTCSNLTFYDGIFRQSGGAHFCGTIVLPAAPYSYLQGADGLYSLSGGALVSGDIPVGWKIPYGPAGPGYFEQTGGVHTNRSIQLRGVVRGPSPGHADAYGFYTLSGGRLVSEGITVDSGNFVQYGGTNRIGALVTREGGAFALYGGQLITSNTMCYGNVDSFFSQTGGVQTVQNRLLLDGTYAGSVIVRYAVSGGTLDAANIEVGPGASFNLWGGQVYNSTLFTLRDGGQVNVGIVTNGQLGQLQILSSGTTLFLNAGGEGLSVLRFKDSHAIPWSGTLQVRNWRSTWNHIFIGTDSHGLTADQLNHLSFAQPEGASSDYPAVLLSTGEVVPALFEDFAFVANNGTVAITGYTGPGGDVVIPDTLHGLAVTGIGSYAFAGCTRLTSITVPRSVTAIGNSAFQLCTGMMAVYFAGDAPSAGANVFENAIPTIYYLPGTVGWGSSFAGRPTAPWVLPNPVILGFGPSFGFQGGQFGFRVSWATNAFVVVEGTTVLESASWIPLRTNALVNGWFFFSDPQSGSFPQRFYRVMFR